jgi:hypothetical protein
MHHREHMHPFVGDCRAVIARLYTSYKKTAKRHSHPEQFAAQLAASAHAPAIQARRGMSRLWHATATAQQRHRLAAPAAAAAGAVPARWSRGASNLPDPSASLHRGADLPHQTCTRVTSYVTQHVTNMLCDMQFVTAVLLGSARPV